MHGVFIIRYNMCLYYDNYRVYIFLCIYIYIDYYAYFGPTTVAW